MKVNGLCGESTPYHRPQAYIVHLVFNFCCERPKRRKSGVYRWKGLVKPLSNGRFRWSTRHRGYYTTGSEKSFAEACERLGITPRSEWPETLIRFDTHSENGMGRLLLGGVVK